MGTVATGVEMRALRLKTDFFKISLGKSETRVNFHIWVIFHAEKRWSQCHFFIDNRIALN